MNDSLNMSDLNGAILAAVVHEEKVNYPVSIDKAIDISIDITLAYVVEWLHERGDADRAAVLDEMRSPLRK